jgi:hypothetical protein
MPRDFNRPLQAPNLAHGAEDDVVREVLGRVIDDPVGAEALDQFEVRRSIDARYRGAELLDQLRGRRADRAGRSVHEAGLSAPSPRRLDVGEGVVRRLRGRRSLLEGKALGHRGDRVCLRDREVLGMRPNFQSRTRRPDRLRRRT